MDKNEAVQALYEQFPYPRLDEDLESILAGKRRPAWNPRDSHPIYFPDQAPRQSLDILIAGCGTNTGQQHAAYLPHMRCVAIDISEHSLANAKRVADRYGLKNIEFFKLPIERVAELGRTFDYVSCHGVLHHLEDPVAGLKALKSVTRPDGALSIMLYGRYGRTGIYMLQELFRDRLALMVREQDLRRVQAALTVLPEEHPFRIVHQDRKQLISLEELADMLLHPRDLPYAVKDVRALVEQAGLQFQRWLGQAHYRPEVSSLASLGLAMDHLSSWEQAEAMELFYGTLIKHEFCLAHPGRPTPAQLFQPARLPSAIPSLSAHLMVEPQGDQVVLKNQQHQMGFRGAFSIRSAVGLLKNIDGARTIEEVIQLTAQQRKTDLDREQALALFQRWYASDFIDLRAS